jgi:hypothetical protein
MTDKLARLIALYLPQFHPIPENDEWWGKGFTEWTNVVKAKPLFRGHYQPHIPADLGFYDLRISETRLAQAEMAQAYGIEGFCYYHYWFGGRRLLERPLDEVLRSGEPDFPFCLAWANATWSGVWHGCPHKILIEQTYPGPKDDESHFYILLKAFTDKRYLKVDGKPMFLVYVPKDLPNPRRTTDLWRELALKEGLKGLYLVAMQVQPWDHSELGFDAAARHNLGMLPKIFDSQGPWGIRRLIRAWERRNGYPRVVYPYKKAIQFLNITEASRIDLHPIVIPNWDNTPRCGQSGWVLTNSHPELFRMHLHEAIKQVKDKPQDCRIIFIKSWNEWAEGNYLEPDLKSGRAYLEVIKEEVNRSYHSSE